MQFVWLIATLVEARPGSNQMFQAGERTLVQCFVPAKPLETALEQLDAFLDAENYERRDIVCATRYDRQNPDDGDWEGNLGCVEEVARTGKPCFGVFITSPDLSPTWKHREPRKNKQWWKFW